MELITFCEICDSIQVDPAVSVRCAFCTESCERHIEQKRLTNHLIFREELDICDVCGTEIEFTECKTNVTIENKTFNCNKPFNCPFIRQFNCHCNCAVTDHNVDNHRECYPECSREQCWIKTQNDQFKRNYYLNSSFSRNFLKLLSVTNLESPIERLDLLVWIARYAGEYDVACNWIKENVTFEEIDLNIRQLYPQVVEKWQISIFEFGYVLK